MRSVWKHEVTDFTPWLQENIDVIGEAIGMSLVEAEREQSVGDFSADLVAETQDGRTCVIENQFGRSDHDHLGKIVTYMTALDANIGVWLVEQPRAEHVQAITMLNEFPTKNFFMVKVEAIMIGDSPPAPLFTLIVGPSEVGHEAGRAKAEKAERYSIRKSFWSRLLERAKEKTKLHAALSPGEYSWIGTSASLPPGLALNYGVRKSDAKAELYIDTHNKGVNEAVLAELATDRAGIESAFGGPLDFQELTDRRACRIEWTTEIGGWQDEAAWDAVHEAMIDAMIRLDKALKPRLKAMDSKIRSMLAEADREGAQGES